MNDLETALAFLYQRAGKKQLTAQQLRYQLSMDLRWFEPKDAKRFLDLCLEGGLVREQEGGLEATFDVRVIQVPIGFRPRLPDASGADPATPPTMIDEVLRRLAAKGLTREESVARINREAERFGHLLETDVAALIVARDLDAPVEDLLKDYLGKHPSTTR